VKQVGAFDEHPRRVLRAERLPEPLSTVYTSALDSRGPCRLAVYAPVLSSVSARRRPSDANHLLMVFDDRLLVARRGLPSSASL
jgi:hypothetical protein